MFALFSLQVLTKDAVLGSRRAGGTDLLRSIIFPSSNVYSVVTCRGARGNLASILLRGAKSPRRTCRIQSYSPVPPDKGQHEILRFSVVDLADHGTRVDFVRCLLLDVGHSLLYTGHDVACRRGVSGRNHGFTRTAQHPSERQLQHDRCQ